MTDDSALPDRHETISDEEAWHHAYRTFAMVVEFATLPAEQQCEVMGDFNVAWELRDEVSAGSYLLNRGHLSASQEAAIAALVVIVQLVPAADLPAGANRGPNLVAMQHDSWVPVREVAVKVLQQLEPITRANAAYLDPPPNVA